MGYTILSCGCCIGTSMFPDYEVMSVCLCSMHSKNERVQKLSKELFDLIRDDQMSGDKEEAQST